MDELKVLVEGTVKKLNDGWLAVPATVLIKSRGLNVLVDPGSDKQLLLEKLAREKLAPAGIDFVFLTHHHLDHSLNMRLFPECNIMLDGDMMKDANRIFSYFGGIPGTGIKIIPTPGHTIDHESLLVTAEEGVVCVAGDLFWWLDGEEQKTDYESLMNRTDPNGAKDEKALRKSRKNILETADWIIPGHGKMFKYVKNR